LGLRRRVKGGKKLRRLIFNKRLIFEILQGGDFFSRWGESLPLRKGACEGKGRTKVMRAKREKAFNWAFGMLKVCFRGGVALEKKGARELKERAGGHRA